VLIIQLPKRRGLNAQHNEKEGADMIIVEVGWKHLRQCGCCGANLLVSEEDLYDTGIEADRIRQVVAFDCPICGTKGKVEPSALPTKIWEAARKRKKPTASVRDSR